MSWGGYIPGSLLTVPQIIDLERCILSDLYAKACYHCIYNLPNLGKVSELLGFDDEPETIYEGA